MRGGEPTRIDRILASLLVRRGRAAGRELDTIRGLCDRVLGSEFSGRARVASLRAGEITIETDSAALAYELRGFHATRILDALRSEPSAPAVTRIRFKSGYRTA